jgi:predicted transcriptional regulator
MKDELPTPTGRELEILKVLWDGGPASVRDVHGALQEATAETMAFNTVQTLLRIMADKKLVTHHADGRTFIYTASYSRQQSAARFLERVFDGAASELVSSLLQTEGVSAEELERMHLLIAAARKGRRQGGAR